MGQFCSTTQAAMTPSETFHLKWNDFHENMATSFQDLRQEGDFTDVTLACEGNQQLQAHKVILSSSSPFFKSILRCYKSAEPLIYLRQVSYQDLASVVDFMYYGQADVQQENLNSFLALAEEFELKGLTQQNKAEDIGQPNRPRRKIEPDVKVITNDIKSSTLEQIESYGKTNSEKITNEVETKEEEVIEELVNMQPQEDEVYNYSESILNDSEIVNNANITIEELDNKVESMIQKQDKKWGCSVCGKQFSTKSVLKSHAEVHIEGVQHPCTTCGKTYRTRNSLKKHSS